MKDKELEEILDKVAVEAVAIMLAGKAELYIPTVKKYEQKLLAWRDKAVREALLDFASRVGETSHEVDEYLKEQYQQELQDEK